MPADMTKFTWEGEQITVKVRRAIGRGSVALAETIVSEAKQRVHRLTGTLSRSIHSAPDAYMGEGDHESAKAGEELGGALVTSLPTWVSPGQAVILVGSWIPYACVEESRHPYMAPAVEAALGRAADIFAQAFREEGLGV
jgi:hypothetical protein